MPSGNLPVTGFLGDGQRTTSEFQGGINELLAYVKTLKTEVDALSSQVIKEAAVRGVGNGVGDVYARGEISGVTVFENINGQTSVNFTELSDSSDGWYVVKHSEVWTLVYIGEDYSSKEYSVMSKLTLTTTAPFVMTFKTLRIFGSSFSSLTQQYDATNGTANTFINNIFKIVKV